jgi:hypothetical protein
VLDQDPPALGYLDGLLDQYWVERCLGQQHQSAFNRVFKQFELLILDLPGTVDDSTSIASDVVSTENILSEGKTEETSVSNWKIWLFSCFR